MRYWRSRYALVFLLWLAGSSRSLCADADRFTLAAGHYRQGEWQAACEAFQQLLEHEPDHTRALDARFFLGEALGQLGRHAEARQQFIELLKRDPEHRYARQARFRAGEAAYLAGDDRHAKSDLGEFCQRYPQADENAYALVYLGLVTLEAANAREAKRLLAAALDRYGDGPMAADARLGLGQACEALGEADQARAAYRQLAESSSPLADQALLRWGMLENQAGEYRAALVPLARLTKDFRTSDQVDKARLARGYAQYKLGEHAEAERTLTGLVNHEQLAVDAGYWLGLSQMARNQWRDAAKTLLAASRVDTSHRLNAAIAFRAGCALLEDKQLAAAEAEFDRVLTQWPTSPWADDCLLGKIELAALANSPDSCRKHQDELVRRFPNSPLRLQAEATAGQALVAAGRYEEALPLLEAAAAQGKRAGNERDADLLARVQSSLSICYAKLGRGAEAARIASGLQDSSGPVEVRAAATFQVAEAAYAQRDYRAALAQYELLTRRDMPAEFMRLGCSGVGWCQFQLGQWADASAAFESLLSRFPNDPLAAEAALVRGKCSERLQQSDLALAMYHLVIERYGSSDRVPEALWLAARLHDNLQQRSQAIACYSRLVGLHPDFAELDAAIYRWAWLLEQQQATEEACTLYGRLARDFPRSKFAADANLRLAQRAVEREEYSTAEQLLAALVASHTSTDILQQAWYLQGRVALAQQKWDAVTPPLEKLLESNPAGELAPAANYLLAEAHYRQGDFQKAAERLAVLSADNRAAGQPWYPTAQLRRAQSLAQLKEWHEALDVAQEISARYPTFEEAHEVNYLIGRAWAAQAEFEQARTAYAKVIASPRAKQTQLAGLARWMLGETYFHQEDYRRALAEYEQVDTSSSRWRAAALLQAGKCHEMLGQWSEALAAYQHLLTDYSGSEFADEARRRQAVARDHTARVNR